MICHLPSQITSESRTNREQMKIENWLRLKLRLFPSPYPLPYPYGFPMGITSLCHQNHECPSSSVGRAHGVSRDVAGSSPARGSQCTQYFCIGCPLLFLGFTSKLFGWEGVKSSVTYGRSGTKVSGVGVKSFQILKLFRGTKALLLLLLILFFMLIF